MADDHPVLELRQYRIKPGRRDAMIALFEAQFVESQEAEGARLPGLFRDLDDPCRFTWLREFDTMTARQLALAAFYFGPVWQAHRAGANAELDDNDNVLLLREARPGSGLPWTPGALPPVGAIPPDGLVTAVIHYLWKAPDEGFTAFFLDDLAPQLTEAGLSLLGAYVPEEAPNNFPRLPVRPDAKVLVWFTRVERAETCAAALRALRARPELRAYEERAAQVLRLAPTGRSRLR
jgi:hypothetical protein